VTQIISVEPRGNWESFPFLTEAVELQLSKRTSALRLPKKNTQNSDPGGGGRQRVDRGLVMGLNSGPHYLYRPRPGVKACGLTGLLVITEERERWEQRLVELYAVMTVEYKFVSVRPLSLQLPRRRSPDVAVSIL
jgi:hypothetical protein